MNIHDLQTEVGAWHRSVFGEYDAKDHVRAIAQKAQEESRELRNEPCPEEVADLLICALAAADRLGMDAVEAVRAKLEILRHPDRNQRQRDRQRGIVQADVLERMNGHAR